MQSCIFLDARKPEKRKWHNRGEWPRATMKRHIFRRALSATLIMSLLAPVLGFAQQGATGPPAAPPTVPARPVLPAAAPPPPSRIIPGPEYRVGPGDILDVQIAGRLEVIRSQVAVDLEGAVNMPPLGSIPLSGLTLLEAHRRIAARAHAISATTSMPHPSRRPTDAAAFCANCLARVATRCGCSRRSTATTDRTSNSARECSSTSTALFWMCVGCG